MQFLKTEFKPLLYNHPPHQHSWQTKAINTTFLTSSLLGGGLREDSMCWCFSPPGKQNGKKYAVSLVTLEIEGEWVKVKSM